MPQLYEEIENIDDDFRRRTFRVALMAEWAELDPTGALGYFLKTNDGNRMAVVLQIWMEQDPSAALAAMKANGKIGSMPLNTLEAIAETHPHELAELVSFTSSARPYADSIPRAFANAARRDLVGMRDLAESMDGEMRREALAGVAEAWAEKDGDAALAWVEGFESSEDRSWAMRRLLLGWAKSKPFAALEHLAESPPQGRASDYSGERSPFSSVLAAAAETDFDGTLDWLTKHPDKLGAHSEISDGLNAALRQRLQTICQALYPCCAMTIAARVANSPSRGPAFPDEDQLSQVLDWTDVEANPGLTDALRPQLLKRMARKSPDKAIDLIESLIGEESTDSRTLMQMAGPLVYDLESFERVSPIIEQAFPEIRESLLESALGQSFAFEDREQWNGYLDQLSIETRSQVVSREASKRAAFDPASAIAWADSLPEADSASAYQGLAGTWAHADSYEASQWIATLPPGEIRDNAALMLVGAVAQSEPDSAWQWAQTIQTPEQRLAAMQGLLPLFGDAAADVIEQSDLNATDKSTLAESLNAIPDPTPRSRTPESSWPPNLAPRPVPGATFTPYKHAP